MDKQTGNFCTRCGKVRVEVKTWEECIKGIVTVYSTTACPDHKCQKIVERQFAVQKEKREAIGEERIQRDIAKNLVEEDQKSHVKA